MQGNVNPIFTFRLGSFRLPNRRLGSLLADILGFIFLAKRRILFDQLVSESTVSLSFDRVHAGPFGGKVSR